jgi:hypothetical protein
MANWSRAFAQQAKTDLDAYELLTNSALPVSHRLHYLQMWLEKLCKAHQLKQSQQVEMTHQVVTKVLPGLILQNWDRIDYGKEPDMKILKDLCREIDLLHPQIDSGGRRPDNVEYPWQGRSGKIETPARWEFAVAQRLFTNTGRLLVKVAADLTRNSVLFPGSD